MADADGSIKIDTSLDIDSLKSALSELTSAMSSSADTIKKQFDQISDSANGTKKDIKKTSGGFKQAFADMRDVMQGPIAIAQKVVNGIKNIAMQTDALIMKAAEAQNVLSNFNAALAATGGIAGVTRKEMLELASDMSGETLFDDDTILQAETVAMRFKSITKETFPQAIKAAADLAQATGRDVPSAMLMLGKAIENPTDGLGQLKREGVELTDAQEKQVKAFIKVNDAASAQKIILEAVASRMGGSAVTAANTATGAYLNMKKAIDDTNESIGKLIAQTIKPISVNVTTGIQAVGGIADAYTALGSVNEKGAKNSNATDLSKAYGVTEANRQIRNMLLAALNPLSLIGGGGVNNNPIAKALDSVFGDEKKAQAFKKAMEDAQKAEEKAAEAAQKKTEEEKKASEAAAARAEKQLKAEEEAKKAADELKQKTEEYGKSVTDWQYKIAADTEDPFIAIEVERKRAIDEMKKEFSQIADTKEMEAAINQYYNNQIVKTEQDQAEKEKKIEEEKADAAEKAINKELELKETLISSIQSAITEIGSSIGSLAEESGAVIGEVASIAASIVKLVATGGTDVSSWVALMNSVFALIGESNASSIQTMIDSIGVFIDSLMAFLGPVLAAVANILTPIFNLVSGILQVLTPLMNAVAPLLDALVEITTAFMMIGVQLLAFFVDMLIPIVVPIIELLADLFMWLYNDIVVPAYNWIVVGLNKIHNAFADFINGLLQAVDDIPFVDMGYRVGRKDENAGTLGKISAGSAAPTSEYSTAVETANEALAKNKKLFKDASKAADAYNAVLEGVVQTAADFYEGLQDVGNDISQMLIDSISAGFDNDDLLFALEEYIKNAVIQAAVFTDSFMAQVSQIGAALASAIASGDYSQIQALKNQLSALASQAASTADVATQAISSAFGSYAVGTLSVQGDQVAAIHNGEMILPSGISQEARAAGIYIGPMGAGMSGISGATINLVASTEVDGVTLARSVFKYQDVVVGAAYGG